jgi:putative SOS response-associated peptidase YedK
LERIAPVCGRFFRDISWADYHQWLRLVAPEAPFDIRPETDIRPTDLESVARLAQPGDPEGGFRLDLMRWGLVPAWHRKPLREFRAATFNARVETAAEAPSFRSAWRARRCLVPASGWYEWTGAEGRKVKRRFTLAGRERFMFAGLWEVWRGPDGQNLESFTILTQEAGPAMAPYHHRAPVIVDEADFDVWLDPARLAEPILKRSQGLELVSEITNSQRALTNSEPPQGSLF